MPKFQIETRRGFKYEIETDDEAELDGLVGQIEADEDAEAQKGQPLPEGVTPSSVSAGGGRGFVNPELPTETPRMGGRRGGSRPEMKPYVAKGEAELLDQPLPAGQKTPEAMADPMLRPEFVESVRASIGKLPAEKRVAELQRMAGGKTVEARAAREVLRQAEYENQRVTPEAEDTARMLGVKPGLGSLGGAGKKPAIPSVEPTIRDIDERRTPAEIAARRELAAGVADANLGVDAIAQRDQRLRAADTSGVRRVADVGVSAVGGAVGGFKMLADAAGANNRLSQMIGGIGELVDQARGAASLQDDRRIDDLMKASEDGGVGDQILAAARAFSVKPAEFIAQGVGTSVPAILAALLPGVREGTIAALATGGTVGAAMGAGTIKGGIYEEVKRELVKAGHSEADAEVRAQAAQAYTSDNAGQIALGAVLGGIASATGQEGVAINLIKRTLGKQASKRAVEEVHGGLIGAALKGGAVEAAPEFLQGGQEQYTKNVALGGEGFDVPEMRGVVGMGALEAAAGFGSGAAISALDSRSGRERQVELGDPSQILDRALLRGAMPAETNFTPADSSTRSAGLTDIVIPIAEVPDVGVPDAAGGLAAGVGAGIGAQPVGGVADPGSVASVDGRVGDAPAVAGTAGAAPQPVRDGAPGGVAPALTDPVARTPDADLLARIAQPAGPVAAQPGASNGQGQEAEVLTPAAPAVDQQAKKAADKALAGAQQKARRADDMLRAAEALGETDTIEIARRVQQRAQADLASAQQEATAYVPTAAELGAQAREASAAQGEGQAQDPAAMQQGRGGRTGAAAELTQSVAGQKIDSEWTAFAPETGTKSVPRAEMPQIKAEHRGAMTQFMAARGVAHEQVEIDPAELKPTQAEFSPAKVASMAGADIGRSILVSSDGHILDGHHQWLAARERGEPVKAIRLDAPIDELLTLAKEFPSSTVEAGATAPAQAAPAASAALLGTQRAMLDSSLRAIERSRKSLFKEDSRLKLVDAPTAEEQMALAFAEANGVKVAIVEEQGKSRFNGAAVNGINVLVRGTDTDQVLAVAVHEGIHTLEDDIKGALISAIEPTLRNRDAFAKIYRYGSGVEARAQMTPEERATEDAMVTEEMVAMLGQSEAKRPEFWTKLATKMGDTQFGKFARHVLGKLDSMMGKFLAGEKIQRDAFTTDLPLVQNALAEAYAQQLKRRGLSKDADRALAKFVNPERAAMSRRVEPLSEFAARRAKAPGVEVKAGKDTFLGWLKTNGGVSIAEKYDITGERNAIRANRGGVFRRGGKAIGDLAQIAVDEGWITKEQAASADGGEQALRDMVNRAMQGERVRRVAGSYGAIEDAAAAYQEEARGKSLEDKLRLLGVEPDTVADADTLQAYLDENEDRLLERAIADANAEGVSVDVLFSQRADPTAMSGADAYNALSKKLGGDKAASLALADAGVRGLKYRDANSRGPDGGKSNYVIFRDEDVAIAGVRYSQAAGETIDVDGVQRPVDNSKGQRIAKADDAVRNFWRWFGESKVVDAEGRPLVVYHGTRGKFTVFDYRKIGQQGRSEGAGFYFTNNEKVASGYGEPLRALLSIKKPLLYKAKGFGAAVVQKIVRRVAELEAAADGAEIGDGFLANFGDVRSDGLASVVRQAASMIAADETAIDQLSGIVGSGVNPEHVNRATRDVTGYDGVVADGFSDVGDLENRIYVAFFPEQIKSATGNIGTFDPANPDIRYSQRAADALAMPENDIARLAGKSITLDVDTGAGQATMTMPADRAVRDIQDRMAAAKKLVECLK